MALTLNDKPWYWGLSIGVLLAAAILWGISSQLIDPKKQQIAAADAQIAELDKKIEQGRAAERKLPQFREEVRRLELELEKLRRILPSTRNTEEIIKKIKSLVDQGDFGLKKLAFPKLAEVKGGDPYAEWPITVSVDGRYHDLAILFNRLSNFSRIMNVENINISALSDQKTRTITSDFVAKTFVYVEPATPAKGAAPGKPGGAGKPGGGAKGNTNAEAGGA
ncbi:MAG TPA: type 4a pilus biogenesis protein PilO [Thermoanaerobaculia bacterium]|nr:type 4a pilus biogenesis protein PilO [Thermoanaerobaculia bacterium]